MPGKAFVTNNNHFNYFIHAQFLHIRANSKAPFRQHGQSYIGTKELDRVEVEPRGEVAP
jgi:hypothetical protein